MKLLLLTLLFIELIVQFKITTFLKFLFNKFLLHNIMFNFHYYLCLQDQTFKSLIIAHYNTVTNVHGQYFIRQLSSKNL